MTGGHSRGRSLAASFGEDTDQVGASLDLLVQAFEQVGAPHLAPVILGKVEVDEVFSAAVGNCLRSISVTRCQWPRTWSGAWITNAIHEQSQLEGANMGDGHGLRNFAADQVRT